MVTVEPELACEPPAGSWLRTTLFWPGSPTTWHTALGLRPAARMAALALDCSSPTTSGTVTSSGPVEIVIVTVDP